jgi:hypothetical protein
VTVTETLFAPPELDQGDPKVAHIVKKGEIASAYVEGTPLTALCGKVFVPTRDPKKVPNCQPCQEIARGAWGDRAEGIGT